VEIQGSIVKRDLMKQKQIEVSPKEKLTQYPINKQSEYYSEQ